jgi:predicted dehydrogenase
MMKWALVGTGAWAHTVHAPCLANHSGIEFAGVWGRDHERSAALANKFGVRSFRSFDELLGAVDAVSFAVAPAGQAELAPRANASGVHVLLEKPAAMDAKVLREMASSRLPGRQVMVFLTRLFDPIRAAWLRTALASGFDHAEVLWVSSAMRPGGEYNPSNWRRGPGTIWDVMPHILSQLIPVLGDVAHAVARPWPAKNDGLIIELEHATGSRSEIHTTLSAEPAEKAEWIRFSRDQMVTMSPPGPLDKLAAYHAAIDTILHTTDLGLDPMLRHATLDAAVTPTSVMTDLVSSLER